jgi:hypothetical protein
MPKSSPITREHILDAMTYMGTGPSRWPFGSHRTIYLVIDPRNGAAHPAKLVLTTAGEMASGDRRLPLFSGGEPTNKRLRELGFLVVEKAASAKLAS